MRLEVVEWHATRIGLEVLNRLMQRFKIGCRWWGGWYVHNFWMQWLKTNGEILIGSFVRRGFEWCAVAAWRLPDQLASYLAGCGVVTARLMRGHKPIVS